MSAKHTPGPWFVVIDGTLSAQYPVITTDEYSDDFEEREDVAEISLPIWTTPNGPTGRKHTTHAAVAMANAHLIAAAPDLLAALEGIVSVDPNGRPLAEVTTVSLERACAAIAKAKAKP